MSGTSRRDDNPLPRLGIRRTDQPRTFHLGPQRPQRHQFARKAEVDSLLTPLAEQIAQHTRQHGELSERQALLEQQLGATRIALGEAQQRQTECAPLLRQAFEEQSTLARLAKDATLSAEARQAAELTTLE